MKMLNFNLKTKKKQIFAKTSLPPTPLENFRPIFDKKTQNFPKSFFSHYFDLSEEFDKKTRPKFSSKKKKKKFLY